MDKTTKEMVERYQCDGCVCGSDTQCYKPNGTGVGCQDHVVGTTCFPVGKIFLGMPTGFNRMGGHDEMSLILFVAGVNEFSYDKYNVPVWKHLDANGNTLVRGMSPRINNPFLHVYKGDCMSEIDCLEITTADMDNMD